MKHKQLPKKRNHTLVSATMRSGGPMKSKQRQSRQEEKISLSLNSGVPKKFCGLDVSRVLIFMQTGKALKNSNDFKLLRKFLPV